MENLVEPMETGYPHLKSTAIGIKKK